jgi:hypothetical protein
MPCHASFPWNQDKHRASSSSSNNTSSRHLPLQAETKALKPHHCRQPPTPYCSTPTLHCYKKLISTLVTLLTTQPHLHFASSLARTLCHWSSTRHHRSLSLSYPIFIPKLSTYHMHDPGSIVLHIQPKVFTNNQMS